MSYFDYLQTADKGRKPTLALFNVFTSDPSKKPLLEGEASETTTNIKRHYSLKGTLQLIKLLPFSLFMSFLFPDFVVFLCKCHCYMYISVFLRIF
jgi:hypothetical protein